MPELAERPIQEEEKISAEHQKLPEVENLKPSTDELERTAEAIEGEDPRLSRYRQAMVEAREDIKSISESDNLKSLLEQALNEYVKSIHDMQNDQNNPFEAEIVKVKSRLDELDKGLMGNRGGEESLNNLYAAHVSLKKREISDEKANLTRRLFHLVDESRALYEERREEAHNYLAGLIFEACEKAGTFHVIDNAKDLEKIFISFGYNAEAKLLEMSIQSGKVQEKDSVSIIRDKLKESPDFVDFLKKVDIVAVEYTRKNLSNTEHAARVGGGEIKAIKDKTQQFINTALLYFKKKLATEATQRASNDEQRVA